MLEADLPDETADLSDPVCAGVHYSQVQNTPSTAFCRLRPGLSASLTSLTAYAAVMISFCAIYGIQKFLHCLSNCRCFSSSNVYQAYTSLTQAVTLDVMALYQSRQCPIHGHSLLYHCFACTLAKHRYSVSMPSQPAFAYNIIIGLAFSLQGSLISSVLIFLVLFVGYVWDQVRVYWTMRQAEQLQQQRPVQQPQPQVHKNSLFGCAVSHFFPSLGILDRLAVEAKFSTLIVHL